MQIIRPDEFTAPRAWGAMDITSLADATVRLHWTDKSYVWHVNDGPEVFVVLDGEVDMQVTKEPGDEFVRLRAGDIFYAADGDGHCAHPIGEARVLVVERRGSV